jgi:hypothetical protein
MTNTLARAIILAVIVLAPRPARAQGYPFSQRGSVSQTVAFTTIAIEYGRPVARGRLLFGDSGVVKWNAIWHPGADSATRISLDHDVLIENQPLAAGEYSLWLLPRNGAAWSVIFNRTSRTFHTPYPGQATDVLRVDVTPERGAHMESLAIYFPQVLRDSTVLRVHWGETIVPVRIRSPYRP